MKYMYRIVSIFFIWLVISGINTTNACTNFLVTRGASADGSTMITYAADSHVLYGELYFRPAADYPEGSMLDIYEWDTGYYLGKIKQVAHTYSVVGNMNEHQVSIGETTYGGRDELGSQAGAIMDYGSLIYTTLQRSKTAREAIRIIADLMDEYGYYSSGESFSIADPNEVWIMELIGKGGTVTLTNSSYKSLAKQNLPKEVIKKLKSLKGQAFESNSKFFEELEKIIGKKDSKHYGMMILRSGEMSEKGAVWVARMVPDGYVCAHANQARITTFPFQNENKWNDKTQTTFHSADVISFARNKGWFEGNDKDFSFSDTYAPVGFGGARFCEIRVWSFFKDVNGEMQEYFDYASGHIKHDDPNGYASNRMPLWIKPDKKVSNRDLMNAMRDHLEGTDLDMAKDMGAGPFECPYRWRPLTWKVDDVTYVNERATATQQTGFSFVAQMRNYLPNEIGGIFWFSVDDAASSVYFPVYCSVTEIPDAFKQGYGAMMQFKKNAAFWIFSQVSNFAYTRYNVIHPEIEEYQQKLEKKYTDYTPAIDMAAKSLHKSSPDLAIEFLTDYSVNTGNRLAEDWQQFYKYLFTKYMDGNIKTENPGFQNPHLKQPGYGEDWYKRIVKDTGDKLKYIGDSSH